MLAQGKPPTAGVSKHSFPVILSVSALPHRSPFDFLPQSSVVASFDDQGMLTASF
ncbi:uncharacterized protein METZ01_LOCUS328131 [marine metagenome]|uniref:Uncharacterized protein n=1 Tax=marine metagenome TaxID=408172 RepID=A0A382PR03_9ZZZZ